MTGRVGDTVARVGARVLGRLGYEVRARDGMPPIPPDCDEATRRIIQRVQPYTLTPPERIMALCDAVRYIVRNGIEGTIVECGVWRGGSMMAAASTLVELGASDRELYLFDTFTEFPKPEARDRHAWADGTPDELYETITTHPVFAHIPIEQVRALVESTGHPSERIHIIQGLVEDTIPERAPERIALCLLDTDWYRSTKHELEHLYERISPGGVLIIDDYGEYEGARDATDEFLATLPDPPLLHRVDTSCRVAVKP